MKQGRADKSGKDNYLPENPDSKKVSVPAVEQMGMSTHYRKDQLYAGKGFKAPADGKVIHRTGSQGRH